MKLLSYIKDDLNLNWRQINSVYRSFHYRGHSRVYTRIASPYNVKYPRNYYPLSLVISKVSMLDNNSVPPKEKALYYKITERLPFYSYGKSTFNTIYFSKLRLHSEQKMTREVSIKKVSDDIIKDLREYFYTVSESAEIPYIGRGFYRSYNKKRDIGFITLNDLIPLSDYYVGAFTILVEEPSYNDFIVNDVLGVSSLKVKENDLLPIAFLSVKKDYVKHLRWLFLQGKEDEIIYSDNFVFVVDNNYYRDKVNHKVFIKYVNYYSDVFKKFGIETVYDTLVRSSLDNIGYSTNKLINFLNNNNTKIEDYRNNKLDELNVDSAQIETDLSLFTF